MLMIEEFHEKVLSGRYESPSDHLPAKALRRGFCSWWRFFVSGLGKTVIEGASIVRKDTFTFDTFSHLAYRMMNAVESTGCPVEFEGFDNLAALKGKPFVAVANHTSLIETMLLPAALFSANKTTVIAKRSLSKYPGFGTVLKACRPILLDRKNPRKDLADTLEQGEALIKDGISILLFPQGHRSEVFDPRKFNSLGAKLAARANAPLVPIACKTDFARPGWPLKDFGPVDPSRPVKFACGPALSPDLPQREIQEACLAHISEKLSGWGVQVSSLN